MTDRYHQPGYVRPPAHDHPKLVELLGWLEPLCPIRIRMYDLRLRAYTETSLTSRQVERWLRNLRKFGVVTVHKQTDENGRTVPSLWTCNFTLEEWLQQGEAHLRQYRDRENARLARRPLNKVQAYEDLVTRVLGPDDRLVNARLFGHRL